MSTLSTRRSDADRAKFQQLLLRRNQLWGFYNERGLSRKLPNVNDLIARYAYKDTLASLLDVYADVPHAWKTDLKHFDTGTGVASLCYRAGQLVGWSKLHKGKHGRATVQYPYTKKVPAGSLRDDKPPSQQFSMADVAARLQQYCIPPHIRSKVLCCEERFNFTSYDELVKNMLQKLTALQNKGYDIVTVQVDTFVSNWTKGVNVSAKLVEVYLAANGDTTKQSANSELHETTSVLIWYRRRESGAPVQPPIECAMQEGAFASHDTLMNGLIQKLRHPKTDLRLLGVNVDTYLPPLTLVQRLEKTVALALYHPETAASRAMSIGTCIYHDRPLLQWCKTSASSYDEVKRTLLNRVNELQRTGHALVNAQIDSYRPLFEANLLKNYLDVEVNHSMMIVLYQARGTDAPTPPRLYADDISYSYRSHDYIGKQVAKTIQSLGDACINVNIDTYVPAAVSSVAEIAPETTVATVFHSERRRRSSTRKNKGRSSTRKKKGGSRKKGHTARKQ